MEQAELLAQMAEIQRLSGIQPKEAEAQQTQVLEVRVLVQQEGLLVVLRSNLLAGTEVPTVQTAVQHIMPAAWDKARQPASLAKRPESFIPAAAVAVAAMLAERLMTAVPVVKAVAVTAVMVVI